ncbi:MAG TPA: sigma-70 family RNA polymerase sigma factor [Longimicrobiales bacterium]
MSERDVLAQHFEEHRTHLRAVAGRLLGSTAEADDAVQEAWLRLSRTDADTVQNLRGWLTTVVARVCLDMLRSRRSRREEPLELPPAPAHVASTGDDPEREIALAEALGPALLIVLDTLSPAERVAFVLHDVFDLPFDDIASILDRSLDATRQLASRARRRVRGAARVADDFARRQQLVAAFLAASRAGDLSALLAVLDPDVVLSADPKVVEVGVMAEARGAPAVAGMFAGRARDARPALLDGAPGLVWAPGGRTRGAMVFTIRDDRITGIDLVAEPDRLAGLDIAPLPTPNTADS